MRVVDLPHEGEMRPRRPPNVQRKGLGDEAGRASGFWKNLLQGDGFRFLVFEPMVRG